MTVQRQTDPYRYLRLVCAAIMACQLSSAAQADEWPSRQVRIIVPYGAGGVTDIQARLTADRLAKVFGQPFIIDNRPAGGGVVGAEAATRSAPDGYTLYFAGAFMYFTLPLQQKLTTAFWDALTPISIVGSNALGVVVRPSLPVYSMKEFIAYAKAHPGQLNYAAAGGGAAALAAVELAKRAGLDMVAVPFGSGPASVTAVMSGNADLYFGNLSDVIDQSRAGGVRMLAVSSETRLPQLPDVPIVADSVPGYTLTTWNGYFAPTGTPQAIIDKLSSAVAAISQEPAIVTRLDAFGIDAMGTTSAEMKRIIARDKPFFQSAIAAPDPAAK